MESPSGKGRCTDVCYVAPATLPRGHVVLPSSTAPLIYLHMALATNMGGSQTDMDEKQLAPDDAWLSCKCRSLPAWSAPLTADQITMFDVRTISHDPALFGTNGEA